MRVVESGEAKLVVGEKTRTGSSLLTLLKCVLAIVVETRAVEIEAWTTQYFELSCQNCPWKVSPGGAAVGGQRA